MTRRFPPRPLAALALMAPLAGCISFAAKPPTALLTLTADAAPAAGQTVSSASTPSITIDVPSTPAAIATQRVPVTTSGTSLAYIRDAVWSEPPARLFARLLADTVGAKTGRIVLSSSQALGGSVARLSGELRSFGIDEAHEEAVVVYVASLRRGSDRVYEDRRFEAREPVSEIDAKSVGPALNRAANKVAADVADWVGR